VLEHGSESPDLIEAPLNVLSQSFVSQVRQRAVQHNAARRHGKVIKEVAKGVAKFVQVPPLNPNYGGTPGLRRRQDGWHGLVGQDDDFTPPFPLIDVPFFRQQSVFD